LPDHFQKTTLSSFKDFEDALQYFAAEDIQGVEWIVTRDPKGSSQQLSQLFLV